MVEQLVETMSGLLVPESALPTETEDFSQELPQETSISDDGTFNSYDEAVKWVSKCVVRWQWSISTTLIDENKPQDWSSYRITALKSGAKLYNTTSEAYTKNTEDRPLAPFVEIIKEQTDSKTRPIVYKVVNKL
jgi:hypothetical protein